MKKYETAKQLYNKISPDYKKPDYVLIRKGNLYADLKHYNDAIKFGTHLIERYPESEFILEACLLLERCYLEKNDTKKVKKIRKYIEKYGRDFRSLFVIFSELKRLDRIIIAWEQIENKASMISKKAGKKFGKKHKDEQKKIVEFLKNRDWEFNFINSETIFAELCFPPGTILTKIADLEANGFTWIW